MRSLAEGHVTLMPGYLDRVDFFLELRGQVGHFKCVDNVIGRGPVL